MFERPLILWLLWLAPLVALPGIVALRRSAWQAGVAWLILRLGCFVTLVMAAAGPRFQVRTAAHGLTVVVALDQSRSIAADQFDWMRAQVAHLARAAAPEDRIGVIGFGRDLRMLRPPQDPRLLGAIPRIADPGGTDIGGAMLMASGLFAPESEKKLVLLSDGNETQGDALSEVPALVEQDVQIFTATPPPSATPRVALTAFDAPDLVRAHASFSFRLEVESESLEPQPAQLRISNQGAPLGSRAVQLHTGFNRFELPYVINRPGAYLLSAELDAPPHAGVVNARSETAISVLPPPRLLVVSSEPGSSVIAALKTRGYQVDEKRPGTLPQRVEDYLGYQSVILLEAPAELVSTDVQRAIGAYVTDFGGGLVVAGETLRDEKYHGGPLERVLPVEFRPQPPPPSREPVAIYLCIDRSNSMSYNSRYPAVRDNERIRYAKQAAVALLRQLDDSDSAGVIAFDSQPYVLSRLRPVGEQRAELENRIERLQPGGGTDFKEALEIAEREILESNIAVRQVVLLTDGDTNRQYHDHDQLIADYANNRIPVSTIRIGPDLANLRLLEDFAQATGGVFYRVEDIEKLPQLFVRLTRQAMGKTPQGQTHITQGTPSSILSGISAREIPPLEFFAATDPKDGAQVPLRVERGGRDAPLLAAWQYGLGRSAIFAADPDSLAALSWIHWDRYVQFWSQLVSWVMRPGQGGIFDLRITRAEDGSFSFEAAKADETVVSNLLCRLSGPGQAVDIAMTPVGEGLYRGESAPLRRGKYTATLMRKAPDNEQVFLSRVFAAPGPPAADAAERRLRPPNIDLLRRIAGSTGGGFNQTPAEILRRRGPTIATFRSALPYLLPIAILLLLGEVLIRRRYLESALRQGNRR